MIDDIVLLGLIKFSLKKLYEKDLFLIDNDAQEQCIVSKFSRYFENELESYKKHNNIKLNIDVDLEYNRNILSEEKYKSIIDGVKIRIRPDLILHERGTNNNNILAIEFKKQWKNSKKYKKGRDGDKRKLCALTDKKLDYKYQLGVFIDLAKSINEVVIETYENGIKTKRYSIE